MLHAQESATLAVARNLDRLMHEFPHLGTQQKLAKRCGVGPSNIGRIRRGEISPTVATLEALARPFGLKPDELLKGAAETAIVDARRQQLAARLAALGEEKLKALEVILDISLL